MQPAPYLTDLAVAIADGAPIDWSAAEASARDDGERALVAQLRSLERVASVHASLPSAATFIRSLHGAAFDEVGGRWGTLEIVRKIGSGAHADVYLAHDPRLDRPVALKLLRHRQNERDASAAIDEARLLARVRHPNVVTVYGAERIDGRTGLWMEYVDGCTLEEELRVSGPLPAEELRRVGIAVCEALAAVHAAGLLHRDVKAQNVLRDASGRVLLSDFGTGREAAAETSELAGTPLYLAPEVLAGEPASERSDIYSLGVLLFHLATGTFPVTGRSIADLRDAHSAGPAPDVKSRRTDLSRSLAACVHRALSDDPAARFDGAEAFRRALGAAALPRRHVRVALGGAIAATVLLVGIAGVVWRGRSAVRAAVPQPSRAFVLVGAFENRTGAPTLDGIVEPAIQRELGHSEVVAVASQQRIDDTLRLMTRPLDTPLRADVAREVCLRDGGIRAFVTGRLDRIGDRYEISASVIDPVGDRVIEAAEEQVPNDSTLAAAVSRLAGRVRADFDVSVGALHAPNEQMAKVTTSSLPAAKLFSQGLRVFNQNQFPKAEAQFNAALAADPGFASADIWLAWTCLNIGKPAKDCRVFAQRAMDLSQSASLHEREWIAASYYDMRDEEEQAIAEYEALLRRFPDDTWAFYNLRKLYGSGAKRNELYIEADVADAQPNNFLVQAETAEAFLTSEGPAAARPRIDRARQLISGAHEAPSTFTPSATVFTLLFPAHELWTEGRAADAARVVDTVSAHPAFAAERNYTLRLLGLTRLALGQVRLAENAFSRIRDPGLRQLTLAEAALARRDTAGVAALLKEHQQQDFAVASVLVRAGQLDAAERFVRTADARLGSYSASSVSRNRAWAVDEIEEARGNRERIERALKVGVPWVDAMTGVRTFMYSETLARAAAKVGKRGAAISVLEATAPVGPRTFSMTSTSGYFWMRDQKLLADLYRDAGQVDKARAIERDLLARLAVADPDFPLLVELEQRMGR